MFVSGSFTQFFPAFEKEGYYDWKAKVAGQEITVRVTPDMFEEFIAYDTSFVNDQTKFPNVGLCCGLGSYLGSLLTFACLYLDYEYAHHTW